MINLNLATKDTEGLHDQIVDLFEYHAWDDLQRAAGGGVRATLVEAYETIIKTVPPCPTRTRALNMLVDCRMLANAAITHKGKY